MIRWPVVVLCVLADSGFTDDVTEPVIRTGDVIVAKAKVRNCEDWGEFIVDYGVVGHIAEQQVIILDHVLPAAGLRPLEFEASLEKAVTERIGRSPKSLRIEVLTEDEFVTRQWDIEAEVRKYYTAIKACDKKMDEFREKARDVA